MTESSMAVVLSSEARRNAVQIKDADMVRTATTNKDGRLYLTQGLGTEWIEYAVKRGGRIASPDENASDVVLHDVDLLSQKRVLGNGHLHLGKGFVNTEVTIALHIIEPPEATDEMSNLPAANS